MGLSNIVKRLKALGCEAKIEGDHIEIDIEETKVNIRIDQDWVRAIELYYKSRKYKFDTERLILTTKQSAEFRVVRLDPGYSFGVEHRFKDAKGNQILVSPSSKEYQLSYFESERNNRSFKRTMERIQRRR